MRRPNILLLSAGRRVELLRGLCDAAARLLPASRILAADMRPDRSAACAIADAALALPHATSTDYASALRDLCATHDVGLVIPTIDTELQVLAELRPAFARDGTEIVISDPALVRACRDKRTIGALFAAIGLDTPRVYPPNAIRYPCFSKPSNGSSSVGAFRLDSADALAPAQRAEDGRIFMELVPADHAEVTIDLYFDRRSRLKAIVPRERIETRAGEVSKGVTRRDWLHDYLRERLAVVEGARGCLTLQLFASPQGQSVQAIEINPRFGGGFPLALAAGADFPDWLIREYFFGEEIAFFDGWETGLMMLRYDAKVLVRAV